MSKQHEIIVLIAKILARVRSEQAIKPKAWYTEADISNLKNWQETSKTEALLDIKGLMQAYVDIA